MPMDSLKRLMAVAKNKLEGKDFVVVSHSEPYIHYREGGKVKWRRATGGLVTALDPVMQACGGTWVAYGAGDADMEMADAQGFLKVPPENGRYRLRRITLDRGDLSDYLDGVSHSSLWPWCHFAYVRPAFREHRWPAYQKANRAFADSVLECIGDRQGFVWIQDYHLALAGRYIKEKRPDIVTAHFWHIPWPNSEIFKICPWGAEIIESLLYNDLLGFQIRYYANNFLDAVDQTLQARVDRERSAIHYKGSHTVVKDFPISIDFSSVNSLSSSVDGRKISELRNRLGIITDKIVVGVDRLDYGKGIAEKLAAIDEFFSKNPQWANKVTFVQLASPSRSHVPEYKSNAEKVLSLVEETNYRWGDGKWKPVILLNMFMNYGDIIALYKMADCCLVTSLHDGMNLVSKEYAAAKEDGNGVLVLSKFTGSSRELGSALLTNPYSVSGTAACIKQALEMPLEERKARMAKMRQEIQENDIYKWAADFIENIAKLESTVV